MQLTCFVRPATFVVHAATDQAISCADVFPFTPLLHALLINKSYSMGNSTIFLSQIWNCANTQAIMFLQGYAAFKLNVQLAHDFKDKLARAAGRFQNRLVGSAFETWKHYTQHNKLLQSTLATAVGALRNRGLRSAFCGWREAASVRKEHKQKVGLAVALRFKRDGHAVLLEWQRVAHWQRRCKAVLQQAAGRLKNRSLSLAMEEWQYQTWKAAAFRRAARFVQNRAVVAAFNSWKAYHELCLLERAVAKFTQLSTGK